MDNFKEILPNLWKIEDSCNVYIVKNADSAIAIDFGSGKWLEKLAEIGIKKIDHVFLTHHHAEQCYGLNKLKNMPFQVHLNLADEGYINPKLQLKKYYSKYDKGCPSSYSVIPEGIDGIKYDINPFGSIVWKNKKISFISTPGHGKNALSIILEHAKQQLVFSGDAIYKGGKVWEPYNLEWDHWTGGGAISAWEGIQRLMGLKIDLLCPSHGDIIEKENVKKDLLLLSKRLMKFYIAKGQISKNEPDNYIDYSLIKSQIYKISKNLYQFGSNSYLLLSENKKEGFLVDPQLSDIRVLKDLLNYLGGNIEISACTVSHYHADHSNGVNVLQKEFKTKAYLHESVAFPLIDTQKTLMPWLPKKSVKADNILKGSGELKWNEYIIKYAHCPGQTWNHAIFMTNIDGKKIAFGGDSFQPTSLWNGTGGFCSYNNSRFSNGYIPSCELIIKWSPEIMAVGHGSIYKYSRSKFRKIIKWAKEAENTIKDLCINEDIEKQYYQLNSIIEAEQSRGSFCWRD